MSVEFSKKPKGNPHARPRQIEFDGAGFLRPQDCFGGSLLKNSHAKSKRPLATKLPVHLVLRSGWARMRTPKAFLAVDQAVSRVSKKYGVKVYRFVNVGNHLHLIIRLHSQRNWAPFIRELTGRIAQAVQGISGQEKGRRFWIQRPYTRVVRSWGKAFRTLKEYLHLNLLEAEGFISRGETKSLKDLRLVFELG